MESTTTKKVIGLDLTKYSDGLAPDEKFRYEEKLTLINKNKQDMTSPETDLSLIS